MGKSRYSARLIFAFVALALVVGLLVGGIVSYSATSRDISQLQNQISSLYDQTPGAENGSVTIIEENGVSLSTLYEEVKNSVVVIVGTVTEHTIFGTQTSQVQGSGFVYEFNGQKIIVTNYHVVGDATDIFVTFQNGNAYQATVLGTDVYSDLAVLLTDAPDSELNSLEIASSSTLEVGDSVVAVGSPFGLAGSMSIGIVSQLGRTIQESTSSYSIANIIQTNAAINPGNSGGPLLNYLGQVVGITTAIVSDSEGLGFAVPSDTILREIESLVNTGTYTQHSWLGANGSDMNYTIAEAMDADVTYGWLIQQVTSGGPAAEAGLSGGTKQLRTADGTIVIGGDIIIAIDGFRIVNGDDLLSYLEAHTLPDQTITETILRNNQKMDVPVVLGTRPSPS